MTAASPVRPDWAPTACGRLRLLMRLNVWYRASEFERIGGRRFPARLHEIARGEDGAPATAYDCRATSADSGVYEYRLREYRPDEERPPERRARTHARLGALAAEVVELADEVVELKRRLARYESEARP